MKALVYEKAHQLEEFALHLAEVAEPVLRDEDVLVEVRAVGINPGEALMRQTHSAPPGGHLLLGWEFAGVVLDVGANVSKLKRGDRVFGTGDVTRDGCWAQRLAVDHRLVSVVPSQLTLAEAASLPIGGVTAWEAIFRDGNILPAGVHSVLIVGAAGNVGSMATQLLKAKTDAFVVGTASRPESRAWSQAMGVDLVVDHREDVMSQLNQAGIDSVDMVLSTAASNDNVPWLAKVLRPFGHLSVVDIHPAFDVAPLVSKSLSLHTEMVFARVLQGGHALESQAEVLGALAQLAAQGQLRPIVATRLQGLTVETMRRAHELVESRHGIGKVIIEL